MISLKEYNHIDENKLDKRQALLFLNLLDDEKSRHYREKKQAEFFAWLYSEEIIKLFWKLQAENHEKDIKMIEDCMLKLSLKWNLIK